MRKKIMTATAVNILGINQMEKRVVTSVVALAIGFAVAPAQGVSLGSDTIGLWDAANPGSNPSTTWEGSHFGSSYTFAVNGQVYNPTNPEGPSYDWTGAQTDRMRGSGDENVYDWPTIKGGQATGQPRTVVLYLKADGLSGAFIGKDDEVAGAEIHGWRLFSNADGNGRWDFWGQPGSNQVRWYDRTGDHGTDGILTMIGMSSDGSGDPANTQWYLNGAPSVQSYSEDNLIEGGNMGLVNEAQLFIGGIAGNSNMEIHFIEILNAEKDATWHEARYNGGSPLRGAAYIAPQTTAWVTPGAAIDLRASSLNKEEKEWVNNGSLGGSYPSWGVVQSSGEAPPFGNTRSIPWTSGWTGDGSDDSHHVWGDSETNPNTAVPQLGVEDFSLEMWLERKGDALGGEAQIAGLRSPNHATRFTFSLDSGANTLQIDDMRGVNNTASPASKPFNSGIELPLDGRFHHVVWTWDDTTKILSLYYDGGNTPDYTVDLSTDVDAPDYDISDKAIWTSIGAAFSLEGFRRFQGRVNTFRVYTSTLTGDEANANFLVGPDQFGAQNGVAGYDGYMNTGINWGGWEYDTNFTDEDCTDDIVGSYPGFDEPGPVGERLNYLHFDNSASIFCDGTEGGTASGPRFTSRNLIAFRGLEDQVSPGFQVGKATVVYHLVQTWSSGSWDGNEWVAGNESGTTPYGVQVTLDAFEATEPWDHNTYWLSYCNGIVDAGCSGPMVGQIPWDPFLRHNQLRASPGGKGYGTATGNLYIPMDIDASLVQRWIDTPSSNHGLVLSQPLFSWTSMWMMGGEEPFIPGGDWRGPRLGDPPRLILEPSTAVPSTGDFTTISISGGTTVNMDFTGGANTDYQLQSTTDPGEGTWGNQGTPQTTDGSGNTSFSTPVGGSGEAFRAEEQ